MSSAGGNQGKTGRAPLLAVVLVAILILVAIIYFFFIQDTAPEGEEPTPEAGEVGIELVAEGFTTPIDFISPGDGTGRMFLVDQAGAIWIVDAGGQVLEERFLDLREKLVALDTNFDERGLLGLAFHPNFAQNNRFFVHYSAPAGEGAPSDWDHTAIIAEFVVSEENPNLANPDSEKIILEIDQPQFNHNGGKIVFGPDGYLYIPLGDGGGGGDIGLGHPEKGNGQDTTTMLGSILRIDIDRGDPYAIPEDNPFLEADGRDEIFAYGFRNPYRISFDTKGTGELFVADVGQDLWEEINLVTKGGNYGWNIKEGSSCFDPQNPEQSLPECPDVGARGEPLIDPIIEYRNARNEGLGVAVIGGHVYRGQALVDLEGDYLFADWSRSFDRGDGSIFAASASNGQWDFRELGISGRDDQRLGMFITGIGQDAENELYLLTTENVGPSGSTGKVFKIVPADAENIVVNEESALDEVHVGIENFAFNPETITVDQGTRIIWTNNDTTMHTVTSQGYFDSGNLSEGETFSFVFEDTGTFEYFCRPHPYMEGLVIVQ